MKEDRLDRLMMIIGFFSPIIALVSITLSIAISPNFDWITNALSDLGHYTAVEIGDNPLIRAIIFNSGLIVTSILMLIFAVWFILKIDDIPTKIGMLPFVSAAIFLTAIGIFSENFGDIHFYVSVGFFASFPFAMWFIGIGWIRFPKLRWFSVISIILPLISVCIWYVTFNGLIWWTGMAIPEIITAGTAIGWIWIVNLLYQRGQLSMLKIDSTIN